MENDNKLLRDKATYIIDKLKAQDIVIHRYNAYSTNSIYLKLDYGVCNSIRISDHSGKKHLSYRYNIGTDLTRDTRVNNGYMQHYYQMSEVDIMLDKIIEDRQSKITKYGIEKYKEYMKSNKRASQNKKGFWQGCRQID